MSDIKQGVTLEIFGEGNSMGPVNDRIREEMVKTQGDIRYDVTWNTLGEYLDFLVKKGVSPNVASFVGATTVREYVVGFDDRAPTPKKLKRMQELVRQAMREGALGVGISLIYAPASYAKTDELIALASAAGEFGGGYISHMRSEGDRFLEALDELIRISREAQGARAGLSPQGGGPEELAEDARGDREDRSGARGRPADHGGHVSVHGRCDRARCGDAAVGAGGRHRRLGRAAEEAGRSASASSPRCAIRTPTGRACCSRPVRPDRVLLIGFKTEKLKPLTGKTLAEVAKMRGVSPEDAAIDLVIEDHTRVGTAYFLMSEENVKLGLSQPWVNIGSDAEAPAPEGPFLLSNPHPRAYGSVRALPRPLRARSEGDDAAGCDSPPDAAAGGRPSS